MEKHKIIGEMYGVLLLIKEEYEEQEREESFQDYSTKRVKELQGQAFDWLLEDERENQERYNDED